LLLDVAESFGLTGRQAESALRECGVTLNRNSLPDDANGPWYTSGLRFGTPATTTRSAWRRGDEGDRRRSPRLVLAGTKPSVTARASRASQVTTSTLAPRLRPASAWPRS